MSWTVIGLVLLVVYFLPTVVASNRKHHNTLAIFMLNLLLGWSGIFWVVAFVWACTTVQAKQEMLYVPPVSPDVHRLHRTQ